MNPSGGGVATVAPGCPDRTNHTADQVMPTGRLPERLTVLDAATRAEADAVLRTVHDGGSRALVVSGAPGTGRTTMLAVVEHTARQLGMTVAHARAMPGEWGIGLGVASRLFDALPGQAPPGWLPDHWHEPPGLDRLAKLCSAFAAAARRNPLALLVDDVRFADPASDTLLRMVLRRVRHAPLALVVTTSGAWPSVPPGLPDNDDIPPAEDMTLRLGPLSDDQVREACRRICGRASDDEFTSGALAASGGNPRVLTGALTDFSHVGHPVGRPGPAFTSLVTEHRRRQVVAVLDSLSRAAVEVLRVLAVADGDLDYAPLRAMAGSGDLPGDVLTELRASGLVTGSRPVRPADPVVRERALAGMPVPARRVLHAAVAALAHRSAAPDRVVSRILLGTHHPPGAWSVGALRRAAATALDAGDTEDAAALVECALGGHLTVDQRAELLLERGAALVADQPVASDRALALVVAAPGDHPETRMRRLRAVDLLITRGAATVARRAITTRLAVLGQDDSAGAMAERHSLVALHTLARGMMHPPVAETPLPVRGPEYSDDPVAAGVNSRLLAVRGTDRGRATMLAARALVPAFDEQPLGLPRLAAATALLLADEFDATDVGLNTLLGDARRRGARATAACARLGLGIQAVHQGLLDDAEEHLTEAHAELPRSSWHPLMRPVVAAHRVVVEVRRGDLDAAARILADEGGAAAAPADGLIRDAERGFAHAYLLFARGAFSLAADDPAEAERDLRECGRRLVARRWHNPLLIPWRALLAAAMHANGGEEAEIRELVADERRMAAAWGSPCAIGSADLTAGVMLGVLGDPAAPGLLADAERVLRATPMRLRHAEALAALGRSLLDDGVAEAGVELLTEACGIAEETGAAPLRVRVERDLRATAEPSARRAAASGVLANLTAAESRVVEYAVAGLSNPEIASALSVSRRTVELHLSRAYRKLGVSRRAELPGFAVAGTTR